MNHLQTHLLLAIVIAVLMYVVPRTEKEKFSAYKAGICIACGLLIMYLLDAVGVPKV